MRGADVTEKGRKCRGGGEKRMLEESDRLKEEKGRT